MRGWDHEPLRYLENRIRGWIPKKPNAPSIKVKVVRAWAKSIKVLWYIVVFAVLALIIAAVIMFYIPFYAESLVNRTIWLVTRVLVLTALLTVAVYLKRRSNGNSKSQPIVQFLYKKYRSKDVYMIVFGLATGFMLSGLAVAILGHPLPIYYSLLLFSAFVGIGALIGDWIGKKTNYQVPLLP